MTPRVRVAAALLVLLVLPAAGPAPAMDTASSTDLPDLSESRAALYAVDYKRALALLAPLTATVRHIDLYNLLGFANRNLKRYDAAWWYKEALFYAPGHHPAIAYQGELFIAIRDFTRAEKNLELPRLLCFPSCCEEHEKLRKTLLRPVARPKWRRRDSSAHGGGSP